MIILNQNLYKLLLLDTNIIRRLLSDVEFRKKIIQKIFGSENKYAVCFSIYNVIELKPYADLFEKFLDVFSLLPCFMFCSFKKIILKEWDAYRNGICLEIDDIANAFSCFGTNDTYKLKLFMDSLWNTETAQEITKELNGLSEVALDWEVQRNQLTQSLVNTNLPRNQIIDKFYLYYEKSAIISLLKNVGLPTNNTVDYISFPAARMMLYSQYQRLHLTQKLITKNDVMDIKICSVIPYMDAVFLENYQADVCRKAKRIIARMSDIEIITMKNIN